jgi:myo-inositol-1(or 4)-monophosphatase
MHPLLNTAVKAARQAGNLILRYVDQLHRLTVESKGRSDFVSEVDRLAEEEIISVLQRAYPGHAIIAEESGVHGQSEYEWIIDPLDGTTNFLHGFPQYAVSIGLRRKGILEHGVVFDPLRNEIFAASRGEGAQLNGRRIRVSTVRKLDDALLATGFPFRHLDSLEVFLDTLRAVLPRTSGVRRAGSAALDLAYVAAGRCDGFWEIGLNSWDMAAGALLIQEAGGLVTDFAGGRRFMETGNVAAGSPPIHAALLRLIQPHLTEKLRA